MRCSDFVIVWFMAVGLVWGMDTQWAAYGRMIYRPLSSTKVLRVALAAKKRATDPCQLYVSLDPPVALRRRGVDIGTGGCGRRRPGASIRTRGQNRDRNWSHARLPSKACGHVVVEWCCGGLVMRPGWSNLCLCGDIRGCVCASAHGAAGSKQSAAAPAISCGPAAPSLRRLLRSLLF